MTLRVDYQPWGESLAEMVDAAVRAESAGVSCIWLPELHRSSSISAAAVATATTRVSIATGVALAFVRSPFTLALEAMDLDELSNARLTLGMGPGVRTVNEKWHGVPFDRPVRRLRETVDAVREVFRSAATGTEPRTGGELVSIGAAGYRRPYAVTRAQIPIALAAVGPQMLRLAGTIADGWLALEVCSPDYVRDVALPALHSSGRHPTVTASLCASIDASPERARERLAPHLAFYASVARYRDLFEREGLVEEHLQIVGERREGRRVDRVSTQMSDRLGYAGPAEGLADAIGRFHGLADAVKLSPPAHLDDPVEIRQAQDALLQAIARLDLTPHPPEEQCRS